MAKLTAASRKRIPKKKFGLPKERKYPMPDKAHAQNAKARAQQMYEKGKLSASAKRRIDAQANAVLKAKGAKTISGKPVKKKTKPAKKQTPKKRGY